MAVHGFVGPGNDFCPAVWYDKSIQGGSAMLYSSDTVYRPPLERDSAFLEVASGCSWGRCRFCDFSRDRFHVFSQAEIDQKLRALAAVSADKTRLFALGCNVFCLSFERLRTLLLAVAQHMPNVREVAMYARADDILRKTPDELAALRRLSLCDVHVGVESGSAAVLRLMDKGVGPDDLRRAFAMLDAAGIGYHVTSIPGLGGQALSRENALETARLYNEIHPKSIWCMALQIFSGTPLHTDIERGLFIPLTPAQALAEEALMLRHMELAGPCLFVDSTALQKYTLMGRLPQDRQDLLDAIDALLREQA